MRIRDFSVDFIDMEVPEDCPGVIVHKNMVEDELDAAGLPVWVARTGTDHVGCTHSKEDFDTWFVDSDKGTKDVTLFFEEDEGVWAYKESNFVPCDDQLGGNEDMVHNYFFTGSITDYTFEYNTGDYVSVCGSDDLWLFIDGKLAVDIGGVHPTGCDDIDLDQLGLTSGSEYSFDLFYAQRTSNHTGSLLITTSFLLGECHPTCPGTGASDNICELSDQNDLVGPFQDETVVYAPYDTSTGTLEDQELTDGSMVSTEWFQFLSWTDNPLTNPWYCVTIEVDYGQDVLLRLYEQDDSGVLCSDDGKPAWPQLKLVSNPDRDSNIECFVVTEKKYYWLQVDAPRCGTLRFSRYTEDSVPETSAELLEFEKIESDFGDFVESHRLPTFIQASSGDGVDSDSLSESIDPRTLGLVQEETSSDVSSHYSGNGNGNARLRGSRALNPL